MEISSDERTLILCGCSGWIIASLFILAAAVGSIIASSDIKANRLGVDSLAAEIKLLHNRDLRLGTEIVRSANQSLVFVRRELEDSGWWLVVADSSGKPRVLGENPRGE